MADFHYICTIESNYNTMRRILLITAILMANVMTMSGAKKSVNNGTVASGDGGKQLYRYQAAFDGQFIRAWN